MITMIETITEIKQFNFQLLRFTGELRKRYSEVNQDLKVMSDVILKHAILGGTLEQHVLKIIT